MRLFFVFLFIVNILFGVWIYTQPQKQQVAVQGLPADIKTVELLHPQESVPVAEAGLGSQAVESAPQPAPSASGLRCYTLGPFQERPDVNEVRRQLAELANNVKMRKRAEQQIHRYWVYVPQLASREQAIEVSKSLARNNVKDYYIVRTGKNNNAISLGHFREKEHADRRVNQLARRGFDVNKEVIYRQYDLFWLDFSLPSNQSLEQIGGLAAQTEGVTRLDRECEP